MNITPPCFFSRIKQISVSFKALLVFIICKFGCFYLLFFKGGGGIVTVARN